MGKGWHISLGGLEPGNTQVLELVRLTGTWFWIPTLEYRLSTLSCMKMLI